MEIKEKEYRLEEKSGTFYLINLKNNLITTSHFTEKEEYKGLLVTSEEREQKFTKEDVAFHMNYWENFAKEKEADFIAFSYNRFPGRKGIEYAEGNGYEDPFLSNPILLYDFFDLNWYEYDAIKLLSDRLDFMVEYKSEVGNMLKKVKENNITVDYYEHRNEKEITFYLQIRRKTPPQARRGRWRVVQLKKCLPATLLLK